VVTHFSPSDALAAWRNRETIGGSNCFAYCAQGQGMAWHGMAWHGMAWQTTRHSHHHHHNHHNHNHHHHQQQTIKQTQPTGITNKQSTTVAKMNTLIRI
jgi:hypothetical protein